MATTNTVTFEAAKQQAEVTPTCGYTIDQAMPLHRLFKRRMEKGRDLKVIITARNSATGTGKTTLAFWLAHQWNTIYANQEFTAEDNATLNAGQFFKKFKNLPAGSCLILDEAEQLDARRSMASDNVDFSHQWMMCRFRQICSFVVLPTTTALDSRLEELADVWIEVLRRGKAQVHGIQVHSYSKNTQTPKAHHVTWPDVSEHPEMLALDEMKDERMNNMMQEMEEEDQEDPDDVRREEAIKTAIKLNKPWDDSEGLSIREISKEPDDLEHDYHVPFSRTWVSDRIREWTEGKHRELVDSPKEVTA